MEHEKFAKNPSEAEGPSTPWIQEFGESEWPSRRFDDNLTGRPPATPEIKEKMDRELVALGKLMEDSGVWWELDGSLNISLRKGEYIGVHRDVDISVLRRDISKLEKHFAEHGYGLFLLKRERSETGKTVHRTFRRVGAKVFRNNGEERVRFAAIDSQGNIRRDADLPMIDVAVVEEDDKGQPLDWEGAVLPKKWLDIQTVDFQGEKINLSYPAMFLYHKIGFERGTDEADLREFAKSGNISVDDVEEVSRLLAPKLKGFEDGGEQDYVNLIRQRLENIKRIIQERS